MPNFGDILNPAAVVPAGPAAPAFGFARPGPDATEQEWRDYASAVNQYNAAQRNARLNPNPNANGMGPTGPAAYSYDPYALAAMTSMFGSGANAAANMWGASQNGLANIFQTGITADMQKALGQQALNNQAQLYSNELALGQGQLSNQRDLTMAGYQNSLDRIKQTLSGLNPLISGIGNGTAFGGLGTGLANMIGGYGGNLGAGGPLMGFQSSSGVSASLPAGGGLGSYNTGISQGPSLPASQMQGQVNALGNSQTSTAPSTPNAQTTPAARQTMANMMANRSAAGGRNAATNLDRYQQAAEAKLGYDQQAANAQTSDSLQKLLAGMYGQNLQRQLGYQSTAQQGQLGRINAYSNLMNGAMSGVNGLLGGLVG